ncbi:hypothetical protein L208DRAFT_1459017 [Tricholoma matsutake]|nr:hypothetical protein L208DRAFT_1459017 [Tricholoma matsutake 945]
MLSLSKAKASMLKKVPGWVEIMVHACLEAMGEFKEDEGSGSGLEAWLVDDASNNSSSSDTESPPALYEQLLDRLACTMGGKYIHSMLASYDWRVCHAGLMAIAAIGEGTGKPIASHSLIIPTFTDVHPWVRYAACQCVGQLCTDLEILEQEDT